MTLPLKAVEESCHLALSGPLVIESLNSMFCHDSVVRVAIEPIERVVHMKHHFASVGIEWVNRVRFGASLAIQ